MYNVIKFFDLKKDNQTAALKAAVIDLDLNFFPFPWTEEAWRPVLDIDLKGEQLLYLLFNEEKLIGFSLFDTNFADSFAHLLKILIHPDARGLGLGSKLLGDSIKDLEFQGVKEFYLEVEEDNQAAIKTYEMHEFESIHKKKGYYSNGKTAIIMTKKYLKRV